MISLLLLCASSLAAEPAVTIDEAGHVVGHVVVAASEDEVRAVVDDPVQCGLLSPEVVAVESEDQATSDCQQVTTRTRGLWRPLEMQSRRCPTESGWQDQLVQSDDFSAYASSWSLDQADGGTRVTVRVHTEVRLPVPEQVLRQRSRKTVGQMLRNLAEKVTR